MGNWLQDQADAAAQAAATAKAAADAADQAAKKAKEDAENAAKAISDAADAAAKAAADAAAKAAADAALALEKAAEDAAAALIEAETDAKAKADAAITNVSDFINKFGIHIRPIKIKIGTPGWVENARDCIDHKKSFHIIINGDDSETLTNAILTARGESPISVDRFPTSGTQNIVGADDIGAGTIITVAALLTGVAVVALIVVLVICIYAIHENYVVNITFHQNGPLPFDNQLDIYLEPR
jgi:hypothetical protein